MSKPVVVGIVDKQPTVLKVAVEEARSTHSPLIVVHSIGSPAQMADFYGGSQLQLELRKSGQAVLEGARQQLEKQAPDLEVHYVLSSELPVPAIENASADARLVVVGSDDVPWFERIIRSETAGHLARHSDHPVIAVPELKFAESYEGDVVLALDGETTAEGPIRFAFEQASRRDAALHVLHVATPDNAAADPELIAPNLSEVMAGWHDEFPDTHVFEVVTTGEVAESIVHSTETASLVVVGRPHSQHLLKSVVRSIAAKVLGDAHCPIAVVPSTYDGH